MKTTLGQRFRYWLENFMARGGAAIFISLLILFLTGLVLATLIRGIIVALDPDQDIMATFFDHFWRVFLGLTDPGTLGMEEGDFIWYKIVGTITIFIGLIIFSMLIAFITAQVEKTIYNFKKGRSHVIESGHTLILGWNERVFDLVRELIVAHESEKKASIVILAEKDKEEMDDEVAKIFPKSKHSKIITREGDTASLTELKRVNSGEAKSAIVLSGCPDSSSDEEKEISDTKTIKSILALLGCQKEDRRMTIVAELFSKEKRDLLDSLGFDDVISINSWEILGKLLVQTSLSSGLELVYSEILSFKGCEIYTFKAEWGDVSFGELPYHFVDGIPLGIIKSDHAVQLRPPNTAKLEETDSIFILAEDNSTIRYKKPSHGELKKYVLPEKETRRNMEKELILGWHSIGEIVLREYIDFLPEDSIIDIMIYKPSDQARKTIQAIQSGAKGLTINLLEKNPLSRENLLAIAPFSYNNIIILAQDEHDYTPEKVDSDTMLILLLLREIRKQTGIHEIQTKIITQVLNSENQELIEKTNVDDFIISNKMITKIIAQISENSDLKILYDQMFSEQGSEIYLKPISYYVDRFPFEAAFLDIIALAQQRDEICLGIRLAELVKDPARNFGVILNPKKNRKFTLNKADCLVVLAEDEL
ncbi:MAG: hypothetical protein JXJ04_22815 [Spirochaetales bacterium]|nr:hypothetical protein [Spirochaetales bacterium]